MAESEEKHKDDESIEDDDVEKQEEQDEIDDQEDTSEDESSSDDDGDDSDDNDLKSQVQYPHLVKEGDTIEDYLKRVEDAYGVSSKEGKRLNDELERFKDEQMSQIAKSKSDDLSSESDQQQTDDLSFGDKYARAEMRRRNNEAFEKFVDVRPALQGETGELLRNRVKEKFAVFAKAEYDETGEIPTDITPLLRAAWAAVSDKDNEMDTRNDLKDRMSSSKTSSAKKRQSKSSFTEDQIATAQKLYPTKSRKEIEKLLAEYAN